MRLHLDRTLPIGLGEQLRGQLRFLIDSGELAPGARLPSARAVAESQEVNVNTVAAAYADLEAEGYLVQRKRAGTRVAPEPPPARERALVAQMGAELARRTRTLGVSGADLLQTVAAQAALGGATPRFRVALLVEDPLQAQEILARASALFREGVELTPLTPSEYRAAEAHLTVVHPALTGRLAPPPAQPPAHLDFGTDFPAPAD